jgi:hypothetical protein
MILEIAKIKFTRPTSVKTVAQKESDAGYGTVALTLGHLQVTRLAMLA